MTTTTKSLKALHAELLDKLNSDEFSDGTYDLETLTSYSFRKGFQVTFSQLGANWSDSDYDKLVSLFTEFSMDGKVYGGKFGGYPEISFRVADKRIAVILAKKYNQISIWNWKKQKEVMTGGTGIYEK